MKDRDKQLKEVFTTDDDSIDKEYKQKIKKFWQTKNDREATKKLQQFLDKTPKRNRPPSIDHLFKSRAGKKK